MMNNTRNGYATIEDITKISIAIASDINGGGRNHLEAEGRELYLAPWRWWWSELVYLTGASFCQLLHDTERFQFINSIGNSPLGAHVKLVIEILFEVSASLFHLLSAIMLYLSHM
ncbi:unnamed protein product [Brassica oleracea var. botrytis]|uniref:(rape) hypothetical protein n=1 Tax=Brassica napus TaxID=3708 RepID=A0A078JUS3_BRANA|nr:unnamed protein product [Brassica napus]CDY70215.1 BnaCnng67230D [Brassica napus]